MIKWCKYCCSLKILAKCGVRFRSIAELNRTQSTDWVRLSSIFERSIYYAGISPILRLGRGYMCTTPAQRASVASSQTVQIKHFWLRRKALSLHWWQTGAELRKGCCDTGFPCSGPGSSATSPLFSSSWNATIHEWCLKLINSPQ